MGSGPRTADSLIDAGALILYCTRYAQTKGNSKAKSASARAHLIVEFPGIGWDDVSEIERQSLARLATTIYKW